MLISEEKRLLQQKIDTGSVSNFASLEQYLWRRGWEARTTTRTSKGGRAILIVRSGIDRGFQIEVDFLTKSLEIEQPGIWIYALIARAGLEKACYVGQSKSVMRRFSEHTKRSRPGLGSDAFFVWADQRAAPVQAVLLEFSERRPSKGETAQEATNLEGAWLSAAVSVGYTTPDAEKWGRLPVPRKDAVKWNDKEVDGIAVSLSEIINKSVRLKEFCLNPPSFLI
ncbi:hypothetical protein [Pseudogemmobacter humi]|uniref:GIY-YIG domain-containing protein n=1 Tax=Pseudogemmobacter humi TaxID=2483812 RepID=A0A3P5XB88_9RHOB|nr:hypothetical protein [Pseudogemmobacter humi]VDC27475.1 hypothetical protein XINFAN_01892 [Pseudogemmobacter humi]